MIEEVRSLFDEYLAWLKEETTLREAGDRVEVGMPFLDRHNDYIEIHVERDGDDWLLHDDGYILGDLEFSGCSLDTPGLRSELQFILNGGGVNLRNDGEYNILEKRTTRDNFPIDLQFLVLVMLAANDLWVLCSVPRYFLPTAAAPQETPGRTPRSRAKHPWEVVVRWSDSDDTFVAEVPELPGCSAQGETRVAALQNVEQAIDLWCDTAQELGDPIAQPETERLTPAAVD